MTPLPGHFRWREVTWRHFLSCECNFLWVTALCELKRTQNLTCRPATATSGWCPVKWRHFRTRDVISFHVTATCELQPCESAKVLKTTYRPSTAASRWLPVKWRHFRVTWVHVTWFPLTWLPPPASQPCAIPNVLKTWIIRLLQPHPGDFRWNDVTSESVSVPWNHFLSRYCHLLRVTALWEYKRTQNLTHRPSTAPSWWLPVKWRHFRVTYCHVTSFPVMWRYLLQVTAQCGLKFTQTLTYRLPTATSMWLPVKRRHFRVTSDHVRSRDVICCHVTANSGQLQPCGSSNVPKT